MKKRRRLIVLSILCLGIFSLPLSGCGKKDDDSTAIAITPTPSDTKAAASETPTATPAPSTNGTSMSQNGTSTTFSASGNMSATNGLSGNTANGGANKITGTIVAASMNDVTVRTSEGVEYTCSTTTATNNLSSGITLGNNITVTLASMSAVNGLYTATELNELSSAQSAGTDTGSTGMAGTSNETDTSGGYTDSQYSDGTGTYDNGTYSDGTGYDNSTIYDDGTTYDDGTAYDDGTTYDDGSGIYDDGTSYDTGGDYYYYDPASETYDTGY